MRCIVILTGCLFMYCCDDGLRSRPPLISLSRFPSALAKFLAVVATQSQHEGVQGGAVAPGDHLQGRHFEPLTA